MHRQTGICVQTCPVPTWVPTSNANLRLARGIYGHWGPVVATYTLCFRMDASLGLGPLLPLPRPLPCSVLRYGLGRIAPPNFLLSQCQERMKAGRPGLFGRCFCGREVHTDLGAVYRCGGRDRERQHLWVGSCLSTPELKSSDLAF